jgi:hypothetical protein
LAIEFKPFLAKVGGGGGSVGIPVLFGYVKFGMGASPLFAAIVS